MYVRLALIGLAVLGCSRSTTPDDGAERTTPPAADGGAAASATLADREWRLVELNGRPVQPPERARVPTIQFDAAEGRAFGTGGCNRFSGPYTLSGATLTFGPMISTKMACVEEEANRLESEYLAALDGVRSHEVTGDTLVLRGDADVIARFAAEP